MLKLKERTALQNQMHSSLKKPKFRLINPAKSEIGKVSKFFMANNNTKVWEMSPVNQWRDNDSVIAWFENIKNKNKCIFMQHDIVEFYPSISEDLLKRAIESLYFSIIHMYKKEGNKGFDVTMGSFAGSVICELVGHYVLEIYIKY